MRDEARLVLPRHGPVVTEGCRKLAEGAGLPLAGSGLPTRSIHQVLLSILTCVGDLGHILPLEVLQLWNTWLILLSLGEIQLGSWVIYSQKREGYTLISDLLP